MLRYCIIILLGQEYYRLAVDRVQVKDRAVFVCSTGCFLPFQIKHLLASLAVARRSAFIQFWEKEIYFSQVWHGKTTLQKLTGIAEDSQ